jgi:DNA-binding protein Fis
MLQNNNEELQPLEEIEQNHIQLVLVRLSGNDSKAAKVLGFSVSMLERKLKA